MIAATRHWVESTFEAMFRHLGDMVLLLLATIRDAHYALRSLGRVFRQMIIFGPQSLGITLFIALFTGFVVSLQTGRELQRFGIADNIGSIVGISVTREMAPMLTAFIIAGRVGAAMAAELGTMSVTDEVDALRSMGISPIRYLVVPRVLAGFTMMPVLTAFAIYFAFWGGAVVADSLLNVSQATFFNRLYTSLEWQDVAEGLTKSFCFGLIISVVSCHFGLAARGGAESVGKSSTMAVVTSLTLILISDFFLARFLQAWLHPATI